MHRPAVEPLPPLSGGGRLQIGMAEITSESVADFIPELPADFARNTHDRSRGYNLKASLHTHQPRFGGAFCCPRRREASCGRIRNEELDHTLFRFANVSAVGQLEFEGIAATEALCDDGYALSIAGGDISRFSDGKGALLLPAQSQQTLLAPAFCAKAGRRLMMRGKFASPGVSEPADQARRLLKDGTLNALSLCFSVQKSEPMPGGGKRAIKWTALETSLVAVGMDPGAVVTQRALSQMLARSGRRLRLKPNDAFALRSKSIPRR